MTSRVGSGGYSELACLIPTWRAVAGFGEIPRWRCPSVVFRQARPDQVSSSGCILTCEYHAAQSDHVPSPCRTWNSLGLGLE